MDKRCLTLLTACTIMCPDFGYGSVWPASHATELTDQPLYLASPHSCSAALPKTIGFTSMGAVSRHSLDALAEFGVTALGRPDLISGEGSRFMKTDSFKGRDFLTTADYGREEIETIIDVAFHLKRKFALREPHRLLPDMTLFMIFYGMSLRTRNSFEAGMTQLGGHAHFLSPGEIYTPALDDTVREYRTESVADVARVLSRMGQGIAIRCFGKAINWVYGAGQEVLEGFAKWADIPVINMETDIYHPCQGMADILTMKEKLGQLDGKKFVMSWAYSPRSQKPLSVAHSALLVASLMGMNVTVAYPQGFDLDTNVMEKIQANAEKCGRSVDIVHDMKEAVRGADVVYAKNWTCRHCFPPETSAPQPEEAQRLFEANRHWICNEEVMGLAKSTAFYMHCLPADRNFEVTSAVMDGPRSAVFDQAENRLHAQKAIMALTMG
jgi:ornithine carbamoyltransferase